MASALKRRTTTRRRHHADASRVLEIIEGMPTEFIDCREQHAWVRDGSYWDEQRRRFVRRRRCPRCTTLKEQDIAADGSLMGGARYVHPEGYLIKGVGTIAGEARDAMRLYQLQLELTEIEKTREEKVAATSKRSSGRKGA